MNYNVNEPSLPRKCKRAVQDKWMKEKLMRMTKVGDVKTFYGCIYFYAIDTIMKCLEDHPFNLGQKRCWNVVVSCS